MGCCVTCCHAVAVLIRSVLGGYAIVSITTLVDCEKIMARTARKYNGTNVLWGVPTHPDPLWREPAHRLAEAVPRWL
jgi:hypothetical protein